MKLLSNKCKFIILFVCLSFNLSASSKWNSAIDADTPRKALSLSTPNILWLVVEDMSPILAAYGDNTIDTPAISALAEQGVTYTNVYSTSGVCSPSRAALALGMYPSGIGANHMRTTSNTETTGLPKYEAVPPPEAKMLSQYMREAGYYTTNNLKTDYQFTPPRAAWDESGPHAHWRKRPEGKPFFAVVNFTTTHESGLFEPYGFRLIESRHYFSDDEAKINALPQQHSVKSAEQDTPIHVSKDIDFPIPPYLPDTDLVRRDMWKVYNNLAETDKQIAAVLQQLKDDGLFDNTVIVFYSDHGGPLPRQKRLIYDSGLKVPMIIRFPNAQNGGTKDDQLISFIDFPPSTLALAGRQIPAHMDGVNFLDEYTQQADGERTYIHAAADRFDGFTDSIRAVKNKRYKYIRNYRPEQGYYLPVAYREKIPTMQELLRLREAGQLTEAQAQWFRESKPLEELFDTIADPHELNNLAGEVEYQHILAAMRAENIRWLDEIGDNPNHPERKLIAELWQGHAKKPLTKAPVMSVKEGLLTLSSDTPGATISYQALPASSDTAGWQLYQGPFKVREGEKYRVLAHRIGYTESEMLSFTVKH
ncbi:sulfatase [Glaciecola sp. SC05]|uniref:sulfatase family protein n=1 Tax=Glaciecola sp. SC05 TaxID=1987355 RepID=UPI003527E109